MASGSQQTTLLTNIFNEEYLLPFWLQHHKNLFDNIIILDYKSTDRSVEICKTICPNCKIITTRNKHFDAEEIDQEFMEIEAGIPGIKMILNTTEFLFCETPIKDIFSKINAPISISVLCNSPYSKTQYNVNNNNELFSNLLNDDIVFHHDRHTRQIHNYSNGNYTVGRHDTRNTSCKTTQLHIIWLGYYPMNNNLLKRKLQIQQNIPQRDKDRGLGFQHLFSAEKMLHVNNEKVNNGTSLKNINLPLHKLLCETYAKYKFKYVYYPELLVDANLSADYIMINNDINLLQNTKFDNTGFAILDIKNHTDLLNRFIKNEIYFITGKQITLQNYHNEITGDEHTKILNSMPYKKYRYPDIHNLCVYLERHISDTLKYPVKVFNDDIWVRICRPNVVSDVDFNPCHRDVYLDFYRNTVNIYLPIVGSNEKSALKIQPGSHKWSESETIVTRGGAIINNKKYSVDTIIASKTQLNMIRPNPSETQLMLFSPYLIHGCSDNHNENVTRISLEIRFIRNDKDRVVEQEHKFNEFVKGRNWR